jgi:hypothetical protein
MHHHLIFPHFLFSFIGIECVRMCFNFCVVFQNIKQSRVSGVLAFATLKQPVVFSAMCVFVELSSLILYI